MQGHHFIKWILNPKASLYRERRILITGSQPIRVYEIQHFMQVKSLGTPEKSKHLSKQNVIVLRIDVRESKISNMCMNEKANTEKEKGLRNFSIRPF